MAAETAPIKSLEVQVEAQANSAAKALDLLASKLDVIANKLDGMSGNMKLFASMGGNIVKTANQIDRAAKKMAEANNKKVAPKADTRDMEKMSAVLDEVKKKITLADAVGRKSNLTANLMPQTKQLPAVIQKDIFAGIKETAATTASAIKNVSENTKDLGNSAELLTGRLRRSDGGLTRAGMEAKKASGEFKRASAALQEMGKAPATTAAFSKDMSVRAKQFADMVKKESTEMMTSGEAEKIGKAMAGYKRASTHIAEVAERHRQAKRAAEEHADAERDIAREARDAMIAAQQVGENAAPTPAAESAWTRFLGDLREIAPVMKRIMSTAWKVGKTVASTGLKMARAFVHPIKSLKQLGAKLKEVLGIGQRSGGLFRGRSFGQFLGLMLLRRAIYAILRSITQGIKEGSDNLTHYSAEYNNSISSLVSSLNYLKNAWAAAFAPIVNAVAPYLSKFIDMIAAAMNAIGRFMAVLTGKGFAVQAVKGWTDVAAASDKAAGSAGKAAKAAEEYKNTIMSFDELHVLNSPNDGSGGSGGGGGGGAGSGTDYSSMFETVAVDTEHGFAAELRKAFEDENFEEIGNLIAQHIADALNRIEWDNVKKKANTFATNFARTINGFIDNNDVWTALGKTIGESVNTAAGAAHNFFSTVKFQKLGQQIGNALNKGVATWDPKLTGNAIADILNSGIDTSFGFVSTVKWNTLGTKVGKATLDAINGIHWENLGKSVAMFASGLLKFINSYLSTPYLFTSLGDNIKNGIKAWFQKMNTSGAWQELGAVVRNALNAILDFMNAILPDLNEWDQFEAGMVTAIGQVFDGIKGDSGSLDTLAGKFGELIVKIVELAIKMPFTKVKLRETIIKGITDALADTKVGQILGLDKVITGMEGFTETGKNLLFNEQDIDVAVNVSAKPDSSFNSLFGKNGTFVKIANKTVTATGKAKQDKTFGFFTDANKNWRKMAKDKIVTATAKGTELPNFVKLYTDYIAIVNKTIQITAQSTANQVTTGIRTMFGFANGGILTKAGWQPIQGYANGGLVSGEHFIARENGAPELVGRIGTRTAVMNNDQIVASVSDGVYRAVTAAMGNGGGSMPYQINLTVKTQNDEVLARAVERGNASRNYRANAYGY